MSATQPSPVPIIPPPMSPARVNTSPAPRSKHRSPKYNTDNIEVSLLPGVGLALERLSVPRMLVLGLPLFGLSVCWHCLFILTTPYLRELGFTQMQAKAVWFALPLSGVVLTPSVGLLSDHCTSALGRRRPFVLVGLALVCVNLTVFSCGGPLQHALKDSTVRAVCVVGFVLGVSGLQIIQVPVRTLISDLAIPEQQLLAHALATVLMGVGRVCASMLTYLTVSSSSHSMYKVVGVCVVLLVLSCIPLFTSVTEVSLRGLALASPFRVLRKAVDQLGSLPDTMQRLCVVHALCWAAYFCFLPIGSSYFGKTIYEGEHDQTDKGVTIFALGLAFASGLEMLIAIFIPALFARVSAVGSYAIGFLTLAVCYVMFVFVESPTVVLVLLALTGISFAVCSTFPFSLAGGLVGHGRQMGLFIGALDMCMYAGMCVDLLFLPFVKGEVVLVVGAVWSLLTVAAARFVHTSFDQSAEARRDIMV